MAMTTLLGLLALLHGGVGLVAAATPEAAIRAAVATRLGIPEADVEVRALSLPADLPADGAFRVSLPGYAIQGGRIPVSLELRTAAGVSSWKLRPDLELYGPLPVAASAVEAGQVVPVTVERLPLDVLRGGEPVDATTPWEARVDLHRGEPLTRSVVRLVPDLREGAIVPVVVRRGDLEVRCDAELQVDARYGDSVPVFNLVTRARLAGVLQTDGSVLLGGS